ncbi:BCCT family transporter [Kushneria aurantia]|uniref:BCCT family transporter n=1 Tax=Kushneria aurantia TaxID=504092 RepID=A0ABV6G650_9GAMM|nr:BCCT family transporter [Kushneria aurantia]
MSRNSNIRLGSSVFFPAYGVIALAAIVGLVNNEGLVGFARSLFSFVLTDFAWLYQLLSVAALLVVGFVFFSRVGDIRLGGPEARPRFSLGTTFAMALTGGIATGVVTYSVNEPIIYVGNVYGEIANQSFEPGSVESAVFSLARSFHNWTFIPYAMYSIVGMMIAYTHYNKGSRFSIASALSPVIGDYHRHPLVGTLVDIISVLAIALGLASSLGAGVALIGSGIETEYGLAQGPLLWLILVGIIAAIFIISSISGLKRGIRYLSSVNIYIYYGLLVLLLIIGPVVYILNLSTSSLGYWLNDFFSWSLDTNLLGGEALVTWWTMYDWSIWIAYAPLMGLFLARISYGRTLRQFLLINWILPAIFGLVWFAVWGGSAIKWQIDGTLDLASTISDQGAVAGLWAFLQHLPMAWLLTPLTILALIVSFATAADSMSATIAQICTLGIKAEDEPPAWQKLLWGLSISVIAWVMVAFGGGAQGIDGIKFLAAAGGFLVIFLFALIVLGGARAMIQARRKAPDSGLIERRKEEYL